jgi:hypothetical protein
MDAATAALAGLGNNLDDDHVPEEFKSEAVRRTASAKNAEVKEKRIWIQLEDNDDIPPGGQFIGVNGYGYKLQAGVPALCPESVLNVLDCAIMSVAVKNGQDQVVSYRDRLRFPYRVLTNHRPAD